MSLVGADAPKKGQHWCASLQRKYVRMHVYMLACMYKTTQAAYILRTSPVAAVTLSSGPGEQYATMLFGETQVGKAGPFSTCPRVYTLANSSLTMLSPMMQIWCNAVPATAAWVKGNPIIINKQKQKGVSMSVCI